MEPAEIDEFTALLRAHLEWEAELGGSGLPSVALDPAAPPTRSSEAKLPPDRSRLAVLADEAAVCDRCVLHAGRTKSVFSRGSPNAELVFVGEGPGFHEDQQGLPFVGPAGELLDRMIAAMGYRPDDVYVCNVVKCRPPENRTPNPEEAAACAPFLEEQLRIVAPRAIVALGRCATEGLGLMPPDGRDWRGKLRAYQGVPVMPTYHPAFLLRSPQFKKQVWEDLKLVLAHLGKPLTRG
ncbi:MAG: uracil-DNA glycosylase [Polyangiaceae bacterium]|nr:uracil-DNA glycosylase [Polyangiaceae bacterium]